MDPTDNDMIFYHLGVVGRVVLIVLIVLRKQETRLLNQERTTEATPTATPTQRERERVPETLRVLNDCWMITLFKTTVEEGTPHSESFVSCPLWGQQFISQSFLTYSRKASATDSRLDILVHLTYFNSTKCLLFSLMSLNMGIEVKSTTRGA